MEKRILHIAKNIPRHWVGDGFPVQSLFTYQDAHIQQISPFLLLDYAQPYHFEPAAGGAAKRGVGQHPHKGFETVTIVYSGELEHRDSTGSGGTIGPGDVQWMSAGRGIVHEEYHSSNFTARGGQFEVMQLWVNLPAADKLTPPTYQAITAQQIPTVAVGGFDGIDGGTVRVIAGNYAGHAGPAQTHTPMQVWDVELKAGVALNLPVTEGHSLVIAARRGTFQLAGQSLQAAQCAILSLEGDSATLLAESDGAALVLSGQVLAEPVAAQGPFVMNTREEIAQAIRDYQTGQFV